MAHGILVSVVILVSASASLVLAQAPDDCTLSFEGHSRKAVKLRTVADGASYTQLSNGNPVTVTKFLKKVCGPGFNNKVPATVDDSETATPLPDNETIKAKVSGFVLAARFEKGSTANPKDHDLHVELGATPQWDEDHLIVEIPPGPAYCAARKKLWSIVKNDPAPLKSQTKVLQSPVKITVEGYVFLDFSQKHLASCKNKGSNNWCDRNAGRGLHFPDSNAVSHVRGCWEMHPVLTIKTP